MFGRLEAAKSSDRPSTEIRQKSKTGSVDFLSIFCRVKTHSGRIVGATRAVARICSTIMSRHVADVKCSRGSHLGHIVLWPAFGTHFDTVAS